VSGDLAGRFRRLIADLGPISVTRFMGESNAQYYATRDPLGAAGDFVTAPEIGQMFGELIGLWLADVWDRAGRPEGAAYAELGPGRGTLAKDALRAMAGAGLRPNMHLVEGSPALRRVQAAALPGAVFHDDAAGLPDDRPLLLVGNEFLDALPIRQWVRTGAGWRQRMVALEGEDFVFVAGPRPIDIALPDGFADCPPGTIVETNPGAAAVVEEIARSLGRQGGAALLIDYGHLEPRTGSTLQAVRAHRKVDPLDHPGEADLTAHVDFAALAEIATAAGCRVQTTSQGVWLAAMGIDLRAETLARAAPDRAAEIVAARERLTSPGQMGELFKVMALTAPDWPEGAGFVP
jgi:NADH dehydrogenase [ubiquinone] 1 alpha subcomplex assembly factor 7